MNYIMFPLVIAAVSFVFPAFSYSDKEEFDSKNLKAVIVENQAGNVFISSTEKLNSTVAFTKNKFSEDCVMTLSKVSTKLIVKVENKKHILKECNVDFEILLPKSVDLKLRNGYGNFKIQNIEGDLNFKIGSGDIYAKGRFTHVNGKIGSGNIDINGLDEGDFKVGHGDLNLWFLEDIDKGEVKMKTGTGNATIFLPVSGSAAIDYKSGTGKLNNESKEDKKGAFKIMMRSGAGDLTIKKI